MKKTPAQEAALRLLELADAAVTVFADDRGDLYAHVCEKGRSRPLRLCGREFRRWLVLRQYQATGEIAGRSAIAAVISLLEARAQLSTERRPLWNRVARAEDGAIWLDLG